MNGKTLKLVVLMSSIFLFVFFGFSEHKTTANSGGASPGLTGAPGEQTCTLCHSGGPPGGVLTIEGLPQGYTAGQQIVVTVRLNQAGRGSYGFQLTAIGNNNGQSAGTIELTEPQRTQLKNSVAGPQRVYIEQTASGKAPSSGQGLWTFRWTAPATSVGPVTFYVAGLATDGMNSTTGDSTYTTNVSVGVQQPPPDFVVVSAASFKPTEPVSANSIAAGFSSLSFQGMQSASTNPLPEEMLGVSVRVSDAAMVERPSGLFFIRGGSNGQINFVVPNGTANGMATARVVLFGQTISQGTFTIVSVQPAIFTANANGRGVAAAQAFRVRGDGSSGYEDIIRFDPGSSTFVPIPIDLGPETDQVFLVLYGTAFRNRTSLAAVTAQIGGANAQVLDALAHPDYVGLDQANIRINRALAGRGNVDVILTVDSVTANTVQINVK
jgi:uncharacterized protein (TIGR03437 family)